MLVTCKQCGCLVQPRDDLSVASCPGCRATVDLQTGEVVNPAGAGAGSAQASKGMPIIQLCWLFGGLLLAAVFTWAALQTAADIEKQEAGEWTRFRSPDGDFEVRYPVEPKHETMPLLPQVIAHSFFYEPVIGGEYELIYFDVPRNIPFDIHHAYQIAVEQAKESVRNPTVLSTTFAHRDAREVSGKYRRGVLHSVVFANDRRFYILRVSARKAPRQKFLDSFVLWERFELADGACTGRLPGKPQLVKAWQGDPSAHACHTDAKDRGQFLVSLRDLSPQEQAQDSAALLDQIAQKSLAHLSDSQIEPGRFLEQPARLGSGQTDSKSVQARIWLVGQRLYSAMCVGSDPESSDFFFSTLSVESP